MYFAASSTKSSYICAVNLCKLFLVYFNNKLCTLNIEVNLKSKNWFLLTYRKTISSESSALQRIIAYSSY